MTMDTDPVVGALVERVSALEEQRERWEQRVTDLETANSRLAARLDALNSPTVEAER